MDFQLSVNVSVGRLRFKPVMNRRTIYVSLNIGNRAYWLQRWETVGATRNRKAFMRSRDGLMAWTAGAR